MLNFYSKTILLMERRKMSKITKKKKIEGKENNVLQLAEKTEA